MTRSWIIGSKPESDLVVNQPAVSGQHCRLTQDDAGFVLEDLQSTNGTFVNGSRITGAVRISSGDRVTLGLSAPMPWPEDQASGAQGAASRFPA
ncbi:FHA domain-containing protein, partial [Singulisphaera rosea]